VCGQQGFNLAFQGGVAGALLGNVLLTRGPRRQFQSPAKHLFRLVYRPFHTESLAILTL
jgi:hypothetical protein